MCLLTNPNKDFPGGANGKELTCQCRKHNETQIRFLGREDPLEEGMATHSSTVVWRIPWTEEPGGLQSIGLQRVIHKYSNLAHTHKHIYINIYWLSYIYIYI